MNKQEIDKQAEREGLALHKQGRGTSADVKRIRQSEDYNREKFDRLFKNSKDNFIVSEFETNSKDLS